MAASFSAYRRAIRLAKCVPSHPMRDATISQLRALAKAPDVTEADILSRVSALRSTLPRSLWPASEVAATRSDESVFVVGRDGNRKRNSSKISKVPGVHADDLARHQALIERMHFRGPVWNR